MVVWRRNELFHYQNRPCCRHGHRCHNVTGANHRDVACDQDFLVWAAAKGGLCRRNLSPTFKYYRQIIELILGVCLANTLFISFRPHQLRVQFGILPGIYAPHGMNPAYACQLHSMSAQQQTQTLCRHFGIGRSKKITGKIRIKAPFLRQRSLKLAFPKLLRPCRNGAIEYTSAS